jgi:hypothetical protein
MVRLRNDLTDEIRRYQFSGPGGVWSAGWPTASVIRRQTAAPL